LTGGWTLATCKESYISAWLEEKLGYRKIFLTQIELDFLGITVLISPTFVNHRTQISIKTGYIWKLPLLKERIDLAVTFLSIKPMSDTDLIYNSAEREDVVFLGLV
jgi:hypothetical protein